MFKTKYFEKIPRSVAKSLTWRVTASFTNFIGGWLASGSLWVGLGVLSFGVVVNSILYFVHERAWNRSDWGKTIAK
jgi:uncharacterized membrane protein